MALVTPSKLSPACNTILNHFVEPAVRISFTNIIVLKLSFYGVVQFQHSYSLRNLSFHARRKKIQEIKQMCTTTVPPPAVRRPPPCCPPAWATPGGPVPNWVSVGPAQTAGIHDKARAKTTRYKVASFPLP